LFGEKGRKSRRPQAQEASPEKKKARPRARRVLEVRRKNQRMVVFAGSVASIEGPAFTTCGAPVSAPGRAAIPMTITAMEASSATATILRCVARSAVMRDELFMAASRKSA